MEKLHPPQSSKEARVVQRTSRIPSRMCTKHLQLRDALEIGPNELVETSQLLAKGVLAMQAFSVRPSTLSNMVT